MPARESDALTKRAAEIVTVHPADDGRIEIDGCGFYPGTQVIAVLRALLVAAWRGPGLVEERQHAGECTSRRAAIGAFAMHASNPGCRCDMDDDFECCPDPLCDEGVRLAGMASRKSPSAPPVPPQPETRPMLTEIRDADGSIMIIRDGTWIGTRRGGGFYDLDGRSVRPEDVRGGIPVSKLPNITLPADHAPQPDAYPRPPRDEEEREAVQNQDLLSYCDEEDPEGVIVCTRHRGHAGDHVAADNASVLARWPQSAPPQPHDTRKPLDAAIRDLATCYDRMASEEGNRDKASVYLHAAADLWRVVDGARGPEKQPRDGERATCCERGADWLAYHDEAHEGGRKFAGYYVHHVDERGVVRVVFCPFCGARLDAPPPETRPAPETHAPPKPPIVELPCTVENCEALGECRILDATETILAHSKSENVARWITGVLNASEGAPERADVAEVLAAMRAAEDSLARQLVPLIERLQRARATVQALAAEADRLRAHSRAPSSSIVAAEVSYLKALALRVTDADTFHVLGVAGTVETLARESARLRRANEEGRAGFQRVCAERDRLHRERTEAHRRIREIDDENGALKGKLVEARADLARRDARIAALTTAFVEARSMIANCTGPDDAEIEVWDALVDVGAPAAPETREQAIRAVGRAGFAVRVGWLTNLDSGAQALSFEEHGAMWIQAAADLINGLRSPEYMGIRDEERAAMLAEARRHPILADSPALARAVEEPVRSAHPPGHVRPYPRHGETRQLPCSDCRIREHEYAIAAWDREWLATTSTGVNGMIIPASPVYRHTDGTPCGYVANCRMPHTEDRSHMSGAREVVTLTEWEPFGDRDIRSTGGTGIAEATDVGVATVWGLDGTVIYVSPRVQDRNAARVMADAWIREHGAAHGIALPDVKP